MNCKFLVAIIFVSILPLSAIAQENKVGFSDFFQDWTLTKSQSTGSCPSSFSGRPGTNVPGVNGMPGPGYDTSTSVRFINQDENSFEIFTLGIQPSAKSDGNTFVTLKENQIKAVDKKKYFGFSKVLSEETFTLLANGGLAVTQESRGSKANCTYVNAHSELTGKVQVGASFYIDGVKVAQCKFEPAFPRPDQVNFVYNEKCSLGKYTRKQIVDDIGTLLSTTVVQNLNVGHDLEIVRSSKKINAGSETFVSIDDEIAVKDSGVDDILPNTSEYFVSPYQTKTYTIRDTTAVIQLDYGFVE